MNAGWLVRRARPDEAGLLTELAMRSKAVWGYSPGFLERCRPVLTVTGEGIRGHPVWVGEGDTSAGLPGGIGGFYALRDLGGAGRIELDLLFVEPAVIGSGLGAALFRHAVARAKASGHRVLVIESDPGAEGFYLAMGARRTGSVASTVEEGRRLPVLELEMKTLD